MEQSGTDRVTLVRRWFHLDATASPGDAGSPSAPVAPRPGQIVLVTGPSGAGKTTLLRAAQRTLREDRLMCLDVARVRLPGRAMVECFNPRLSPADVLDSLARVGLSEARLFLHTPAQLSEGQRFRLRLALAIRRAMRRRRPTVLVCDEFAAPLDDVTAAVAAHALRRLVLAHGERVSAIVATGRQAIIPSLRPDVVVRCDFGVISVENAGNPQAAAWREVRDGCV